jgi:hypothetical protein
MFSPRRIERATHRDIGVRCAAANLRPDHDAIATFRRVSRAGFDAAFLQVLLLARESGLRWLGTMAIDGIKLGANASALRSIRSDRATQLRTKLAANIAELTAKAEAADAAAQPHPRALPGEIARRCALMRRSDTHEHRQAYDAQAVVFAEGSCLILVTNLTACPSDAPSFAATILGTTEDIGQPATVLANTGFASGEAVAALAARKIERLLAIGRTQPHATHDFQPPPETKPPRRISQPRRLKMQAKLDTPQCQSPLRPTQADHRTRLRHYHVRSRLHPLPPPRPRPRRRADPDRPRLQRPQASPHAAGVTSPPHQQHPGRGHKTDRLLGCFRLGQRCH